jgi:hypothetical protein
MISSEELMATIAWNPDGSRGITVLRKGHRFNADCCCSSLLMMLLTITRQFKNYVKED